MRSCAAWSASSSFAAFATTGRTTAGRRANPSRQGVRGEGAVIRSARFEFSFGASHAAKFVHRIRCCFRPAQRRQRRDDLFRPILGRPNQEIPARRSLYARSRGRSGVKSIFSMVLPPGALRPHTRTSRAAVHQSCWLLRGESPLHKALFRLKGLLSEDTFGWSVSMVAAKTRLRRSSSIRARY